MKRSLLAAAAMAVVLLAANLPAQGAGPIKMVTPDWHYRWHQGRWWYWMPESSKWMVWTGSTWVPHEQFAKSPNVSNVSQAQPKAAGDAYDSTDNQAATARPANSGGEICPPTYSTSTATRTATTSGGGYSGYGWSWGPGTAYRDGPGRRF